MGKFKKLLDRRVKGLEEMINSTELGDNKKQLLKSNWLEFIILMEYLVRKAIIRYNVLNLIIIIGGILIPVLINVEWNDTVSKVAVTILGLLVSISAGINQSYKFNDQWSHFRHVSEELKLEGERYLSLSGPYAGLNHEQAFELFMRKIISLKEDQINFFIKKIALAGDKDVDDDKKKEGGG